MSKANSHSREMCLSMPSRMPSFHILEKASFQKDFHTYQLESSLNFSQSMLIYFDPAFSNHFEHLLIDLERSYTYKHNRFFNAFSI